PLVGVRHEDVPTWLNAADVLLLTSHHEGSPNVIKEALACNLPIVSVDVGDVRERIDGVHGCYLADPAPSALASALSLALALDGRSDGRRRVAELSVTRVAADVVAAYHAILGDARIPVAGMGTP